MVDERNALLRSRSHGWRYPEILGRSAWRMNLEQQVCGEANAVRLRDLGVKQDSLYEYYLWPVQDNGDAPTTLAKRSRADQIAANDHVAAFTVAELGEMLPLNRKSF